MDMDQHVFSLLSCPVLSCPVATCSNKYCHLFNLSTEQPTAHSYVPGPGSLGRSRGRLMSLHPSCPPCPMPNYSCRQASKSVRVHVDSHLFIILMGRIHISSLAEISLSRVAYSFSPHIKLASFVFLRSTGQQYM
jgi:hypothetical protein